VAGFVALLVLALPAGCGDDGDDGAGGAEGETVDAGTLDGRSFVATGAEGETLVDGSQVTLAFDGDRLSARGGCNTMMGGYSIDDGALVLDGPLAQTKMACEDDLMAQDGWVAALLESRPTVTLAGPDLTLADGGVTLRLTEQDSDEGG
jgi:heat shock protein HslJ